MKKSSYKPIFQLTRGQTIESIHHGAVAVVDASGKLIASFGDLEVITFLRSSAKPFQVLPLIERGGQKIFALTLREIAIMCGSHSGTDSHVSVLRSIHEKIHESEDHLYCGVHYPIDELTANEMRARGESPTPFRHNCSGKHSGMLALAHMIEPCDPEILYIDQEHPVQKIILQAFSEVCAVPVGQIEIGTDGCSVPNFAIPLRNAALAYARLSDPYIGQIQPKARVEACQTVFQAMWRNPDMVAGPARFDSRLMEIGEGRFISKGGAEGYQGIGIAPGTLGYGSPGIGIAFKIADGDYRGKVRPAIAIEVMRQLGVLNKSDLAGLVEFGPSFRVSNWRKLHVGYGTPTFKLIFQGDQNGCA
jgi:L-asparaginase II